MASDNYQQANLWGFFVDSAIDPAAGPEERGEDDDREGELSQLEGFSGTSLRDAEAMLSGTLPRVNSWTAAIRSLSSYWSDGEMVLLEGLVAGSWGLSKRRFKYLFSFAAKGKG